MLAAGGSFASRGRRVAAAVAALLLPQLAPAQPAAAPREVLIDRWELVRNRGRDVGFVHTLTIRAPGEGALVETRVEVKLAIRRSGTVAEIDHVTVSTERLNGALVDVTHVSRLFGQECRLVATFGGGTARIVVHEMGRERARVIECSPEAVGPYRLQRIAGERGLRPGTTWEAKTFSAQVRGEAGVSVKVAQAERLELLDGSRRTLTKVVTEHGAKSAPITSWVDADGVALRSNGSLAGLQVERYAVAELRARAALRAASTAAPDVSAPARETYMGRQIAQTMHWRGAEWLMRATRENEEHTAKLLDALGLESGMTVCDLGCGNGYHTLPMAERVGAAGRVLAVEIQPQMLAMLARRQSRAGIDNIERILGTLTDPKLPPLACDLVLMVDVYHEFSHPGAMLARIREALRPGGVVVLVEFRAEDPDVPIKPRHKMSKAQMHKEMTANGFRVAREHDELPWQHVVFYAARDGG